MGAEADNALALMPAPSFAAEPQETLLDVVLKQRGEKSLQPLCRLCLAGSSNASQARVAATPAPLLRSSEIRTPPPTSRAPPLATGTRAPSARSTPAESLTWSRGRR